MVQVVTDWRHSTAAQEVQGIGHLRWAENTGEAGSGDFGMGQQYPDTRKLRCIG